MWYYALPRVKSKAWELGFVTAPIEEPVIPSDIDADDFRSGYEDGKVCLDRIKTGAWSTEKEVAEGLRRTLDEYFDTICADSAVVIRMKDWRLEMTNRVDGSSLLADREAMGSRDIPPSPLSPFASVPQPPPYFLDRPEILQPLREAILSSGPTAPLVAIEGMGGVGKTTITIQLCHDPRVRAAFPDGIVWLSMGKEATAALEPGETLKEYRTKKIARYLNLEFRVYDEAAYRTALEGKAIFLVLDNVWNQEDIEPFRMSGGRSRLLYTSRDRRIAASLGATPTEVGLLDAVGSREILALWSRRASSQLPEPQASVIVDHCVGLALSLSMTGAALAGQVDEEWRVCVEDLRNARLKYIDQRPADYEYQSLHAAIAVGVNALTPDVRSRYLRLAVLLEDMSAPEEFLRALWGGEPREVQRTARLLVERSLARRDAEGIRLHDLQLNFLRGEHPAPRALSLQRSALRLSAHVLRHAALEFAPQMIGRLLCYAEHSEIQEFAQLLALNATRPYLRPLTPTLIPAGGPVMRVLEGHSGSIRVVAISDDGERACSAAADDKLMVWELDGNEPPIEHAVDWVTSIALGADNKLLLSRSVDDYALLVADSAFPEPHRLTGHQAEIKAIALSKDGRLAITASADRTLRVWDLNTLGTVRVLEGHRREVTSVAITADGTRALSGSYDGTLRLWDLGNTWISKVVLEYNPLTALSMDAGGDRALLLSLIGSLSLIDLASDDPPRILAGSLGWGTLIAAEGHALFITYDGTVFAWDLENRSSPRRLRRRLPPLWGLVAAGGFVVLALKDGSTVVWDFREDTLRPVPIRNTSSGDENGLFPLAVTGDGSIAVFGSNRRGEVWNLRTNKLMRKLEGFSAFGSVCSLAIDTHGNRIVVSTSNGLVILWDSVSDAPGILRFDGWRVPDAPELPAGYVAFGEPAPPPHFRSEVAISADGRIAAAYDGAQLWAWRFVRDRDIEETMLDGHNGVFKAMALTPDGRVLAAVTDSSDETANLRVWDLEGERRSRLIGQEIGDVEGLTLTENGNGVVTIDRGGILRLWDLQGNLPPQIWEEYGEVRSVAMTPNGKTAVTGADTSVIVWKLDGHDAPMVLGRHSGRVNSVAISADGNRAISGSDDRTLRVWNLKAPITAVNGHSDRVSAIAVSADGKRVVSGSPDGTLRVWAVDESPNVGAPLGGGGYVDVVAVNADGTQALTGSRDGGIRAWDLGKKTGPRLLGRHKEWVRAIALSPDGRRAVSGSRHGELTLWNIADAEIREHNRGYDYIPRLHSIALTTTADRVLCYTGDGELRILDIETGRLLRTVEDIAVTSPCTVKFGYASYLPIVRFQTTDAARIVCGYPGGLLISNSLGNDFSFIDDIVWSRASCATPSDRKHFAIGRGGGASKIMEGSPEAEDSWFFLEDDQIDWSIGALDLHRDGKHAVSAHSATLRAWDVDSQDCLATFTCDAPICSCAWGGDIIAAGDVRGNVHLFSFEK
jgi:WD40 repeat protein